jgi:hypothetical protein
VGKGRGSELGGREEEFLPSCLAGFCHDRDLCQCRGESSSKYLYPGVMTMCEFLQRRIVSKYLPYDLDEPDDERQITNGLMRLSQQALSKYVAAEPGIY